MTGQTGRRRRSFWLAKVSQPVAPSLSRWLARPLFFPHFSSPPSSESLQPLPRPPLERIVHIHIYAYIYTILSSSPTSLHTHVLPQATRQSLSTGKSTPGQHSTAFCRLTNLVGPNFTNVFCRLGDHLSGVLTVSTRSRQSRRIKYHPFPNPLDDWYPRCCTLSHTEPTRYSINILPSNGCLIKIHQEAGVSLMASRLDLRDLYI